MAVNPYANKVVFGNQTVIDLTSDTADADKVLQGYTFHDKSGQMRTGSFISPPNPDESGLIIVNYSDEFRGQTITCSKGQTTYSKIASILGNEVRFYPDSVGTWTISSTYSGQTFSKDVIISDLAESKEISLAAIPDGKTVLPVNDIQTWLHCAGIYDKNYTTLSQVLADNTTLLALISSPNAVDYMVRSKSWASSSANGLVPTISASTNNVIYSDQDPNSRGDYAWKVFDGNDSTYWLAASINPSYVGYKFASPVVVTKVSLAKAYYLQNGTKVQGSNDGSNWTDIANITSSITGSNWTGEITFQNSTAYQYYRLLISNGVNTQISTVQFYQASGIPDNSTAMTYIGANNYCANTLLADSTWCEAICNSQYFESVLNVKVPTMTSNTTPSGQCIADANIATPCYKFFDGSTASGNHGGWAGGVSPCWCGYKFTSPVKIVRFDWCGFSSYGGQSYPQILIEGSADGITWNNVDTMTNVLQLANAWSSHAFANESSYQYWRINVTKGSVASVAFMELQFYGRRDV